MEGWRYAHPYRQAFRFAFLTEANPNSRFFQGLIVPYQSGFCNISDISADIIAIIQPIQKGFVYFSEKITM